MGCNLFSNGIGIIKYLEGRFFSFRIMILKPRHIENWISSQAIVRDLFRGCRQYHRALRTLTGSWAAKKRIFPPIPRTSEDGWEKYLAPYL